MSDEELLEVGPRRRIPRAVVAALVLLVAAGLVTLLVVHRPSGDSEAGSPPTTSSSTADSFVPNTPTSPAATIPFDAGGSVREQTLAYVYQRTHDSEPAHDVILENDATQPCALVQPGHSARDRDVAYLRKQLVHATIRDAARTIDKFTGLCVLEIRAGYDVMVNFVLRVVAPYEDAPIVQPRVEQGSETIGAVTTQFAQVTLRSGWIITVGTSGTSTGGPSLPALLAIARDPALLW